MLSEPSRHRDDVSRSSGTHANHAAAEASVPSTNLRFRAARLATLSLRCAAPTGSSPSDTVTAQHDHFDLPGYAATPLPLPLLGGGGGGDGGSDTGGLGGMWGE